MLEIRLDSEIVDQLLFCQVLEDELQEYVLVLLIERVHDVEALLEKLLDHLFLRLVHPVVLFLVVSGIEIVLEVSPESAEHVLLEIVKSMA